MSQKIKVTVKLFAAFQEAIAGSEIILALAPNSPVHQVYDELVLQYPNLEKWRSLTRFAINLEFVDSHTLLQDGDEIALIPPVSGG
jgi:sulfur-carrier protein